MKIKLCLLLALTAAPALALDSPARDFSAEVVSRDARGAAATTVARLYAAHGKVRIETVDALKDYYLIDADAASALLVRPGQRVFLKARQSTPLTQVFVPIDAADPCKQWRAAAQDAQGSKELPRWRCERVRGSKYRISASELRLVDAGLRFPVVVISPDGSSLSLEQIHESAQPSELFCVPMGLHELDPREMVERIKHSDVWAAPPEP
jgi:hypothetical protein